jgi:hypothetical protein
MDLQDLDDEDEEDSGEETDRPSSRGTSPPDKRILLSSNADRRSFPASSIRLKRTSSGSGDSFKARPGGESDDNDSDFDLSELKKARLQHPGTISMFGSFSDTALKDDFEGGPEAANAKLRKLFDLPEDEHIVTGIELLFAVANGRIPGVVGQECHDSGVHARNRTTHLLFRCTPKDRRTTRNYESQLMAEHPC